MTNLTPALILNDDIRAYLLTPEAKESFDAAMVLNAEEENAKFIQNFLDFNSAYSAQISGAMTTFKQSVEALGEYTGSANQRQRLQEIVNNTNNELKQWQNAYLSSSQSGHLSAAEKAKLTDSLNQLTDRFNNAITHHRNLSDFLNKIPVTEKAFQNVGKGIAYIGLALSFIDLAEATINGDGDAFGKSATGLLFGMVAGATIAESIGAITAGILASKLAIGGALLPIIGGAVVAGAVVAVAVVAGGYVWDKFIHPDLSVEEQLAAIKVASMIINHYDIVNATPAEVVKTLFGDNEVKEMDFDKVIDIYQRLIEIATGDKQSSDGITDFKSLIENMEKHDAVLKQFTDMKNGQFILVKETDKEALVEQASNPDKSGMAYRYALKELNPFVIKGEKIDYSPFNQMHDLDKFNAENAPNGMTDTYINYRTMFLKYYAKSGFRKSASVKESDLPMDRNIVFKDIAKDIEILAVKTSPTSPSTPAVDAVIFGTDQNDPNLRGGIRNDHIFGGAGKDTLTGGKGDDYLEGGIGYDTYYIEDHDTISDSDMLGRLMFGKVARTATI